MQNLNSQSRVLLWGGTGKSRIIIHLLKNKVNECNITLYDSTLNKSAFPFYGQFISAFDRLVKLFPQFTHFVTCIGGANGFARFQISNTLEKLEIAPVNITAKNSYICDTVFFGKGIQVMPSATVNSFTAIGDYCVLNTNSTVDHECVIGNGVHIMGGASLAGNITVKDFATIGTNATILPNITIGKGAYVGAGAVVTKDVADFDVVAGVPAKILKKHILKINQNELDLLINYEKN